MRGRLTALAVALLVGGPGLAWAEGPPCHEQLLEA